MPELYHCVDCRTPQAPGQQRFSPNMGGALCPNCQPEDSHVRPLSLRALKVLRLLHRGPLKEIVGLKASASLVNELKSVLGGSVRYWLDKEIRSTSFLEHLQSETKSGVYT